MSIHNDLVPFEARPQLDALPRRLQGTLCSATGRAVIRDWAHERGLHALLQALQPERFFPHAVRVTLDALLLPPDWSIEVVRPSSADHVVVSLACGLGLPHLLEDEGEALVQQIDDALWRLGLQTTGLDEIFEHARVTGWAPRAAFERF